MEKTVGLVGSIGLDQISELRDHLICRLDSSGRLDEVFAFLALAHQPVYLSKKPSPRVVILGRMDLFEKARNPVVHGCSVSHASDM